MKKKKRKFKKRYLKKKVRKVSLKKKNKKISKKRRKNKVKKSKAKKRLKSKKTTRTVILSLLKANEKLKSVFRFNFNLDRSLQKFFQGISNKGFDGRGNYTLGIKEQIAFPEISIDKVLKVTGMDITFVTNTDSDEEALTLLTELGLPFKNKNK